MRITDDAALQAMLARGEARVIGETPTPTRRPPLTLSPEAPEGTFQNHLYSLARDLGYLYYHPHNSRQSTPGWPDTAIVHPEGSALFLWELKSEDGEPSPAQRRWLEALRKATTIHSGTYWPRDWHTMQELLVRRTP
jgi:hypothetical protein